MSTVFTACGSTLLQLHSPRALRGRVMSLATVANIGMSQLGGMLGAAMATWVGAPAAHPDARHVRSRRVR